MNLFQVKQNHRSKKGNQYSNTTDSVLERLQLLGFRVVEWVSINKHSLKVFFGGDPVLVQIEISRFVLRKNEAERIFVELVSNEN